ncbi:MAG: cell division protein FtsZ [Bacteroidetes bacterium]|nr:MAG: cell division protein FtsZ [Bacteroidota bacterium]
MEFDLPKDTNSIIKVIGVGGGGSNAVNHMYDQGIVGVDFIVCNTDRQALDISPVPYKIQLGPTLTEGRGAGAIPEIGMNAAVENIDEIKNLLSKDTKMVFVTAGMGGGTGTGAAPVIAQVAKELGVLTVGIVTVPFDFEGRKRRQQAQDGLERLRESVDTLLVINNERLREITGNLSIGQAFAMADNVLSTAAKGIAEVISVTGAINVDFNDVNTVMKNSGVAIMGSAQAEGENRAMDAVQEALSSPLLNDNDISGAQYVLLNITYGDKEVLMDEITTITDYIQDEAGSTADVIWGHGYDPTLGDKLSVTLIATGFKSSPITGGEKAPERKVRSLEDELKSEIKAPLSTPTQVNTFEAATEIKAPMDEPFIKTVDEVKTETVQSTPSTFESSTTVEPEPQKEISFDWEVSNTPTATSEPAKENVVRHMLEDDFSTPTASNEPTRQVLSPEEQQRITQERLSKIQEYTSKLKKAEGITEFENEPAFVRRNVQLNMSNPSSTENYSRFGLSEDGDSTSLRNNNFLHDNVD